MSKVVFILGAGASKDCGAPLMNNFLDTASKLLLTGKVQQDNSDFDRVFKAIGELQAVHSKAQLDLNNIESIFTALEIADVLAKMPITQASDINKNISSLKKLIVKTLEQSIEFPVYDNIITAPQTYRSFAEKIKYFINGGSLISSYSIITFNYDIALDLALTQTGLGPNYHIPPITSHKNPIELLKLHGSLNWAIKCDSREIHPLLLEKYMSTRSRIISNVQIQKSYIEIGSDLKSDLASDKIFVEDDPVIVPPSWNKADYHHMLSSVWSRAAFHLGEAEYIFVIGYSLPETDMFFKLLYALGSVGLNPLKKFVVYNPDTTIEHRFKELLGPGALSRFTYIPMKFSAAINDIQKQLNS